MRTYTVQTPQEGGAPVVLAEGFSWGALFLGPVWFLWHGLWGGCLLLVALEIGLSVLISELGMGAELALVPSLGLSILVGLSARDWWRSQLSRRGYVLADVVMAESQDQAEWELVHRTFGALGEAARG